MSSSSLLMLRLVFTDYFLATGYQRTMKTFFLTSGKGIIVQKKINHVREPMFISTYLDTLQSLGAFGSCWTVKRTLLWRGGVTKQC